MELLKFKKLYQLILENFKAVSTNHLYEINDETFTPIVFKDIYICASSLNSDDNHILTRLRDRTKISFSTFINLVKSGIDKFYLEKYDSLFKNTRKTEQNFCIISRKLKIKICVVISKNTAHNMFETTHTDFYNSKYICFIHTILNKAQTPKKSDIILEVE